MELRSARNHRGYERCPYTAPHVAHKIYDAGYGIIFLRSNSDVRHEGDGHKQESQSQNLGNAKPGSRTETNLQIDSLGGIKHGSRHQQPAKCNHMARLKFG